MVTIVNRRLKENGGSDMFGIVVGAVMVIGGLKLIIDGLKKVFNKD